MGNPSFAICKKYNNRWTDKPSDIQRVKVRSQSAKCTTFFQQSNIQRVMVCSQSAKCTTFFQQSNVQRLMVRSQSEKCTTFFLDMLECKKAVDRLDNILTSQDSWSRWNVEVGADGMFRFARTQAVERSAEHHLTCARLLPWTKFALCAAHSGVLSDTMRFSIVVEDLFPRLTTQQCHIASWQHKNTSWWMIVSQIPARAHHFVWLWVYLHWCSSSTIRHTTDKTPQISFCVVFDSRIHVIIESKKSDRKLNHHA